MRPAMTMVEGSSSSGGSAMGSPKEPLSSASSCATIQSTRSMTARQMAFRVASESCSSTKFHLNLRVRKADGFPSRLRVLQRAAAEWRVSRHFRVEGQSPLSSGGSAAASELRLSRHFRVVAAIPESLIRPALQGRRKIAVAFCVSEPPSSPRIGPVTLEPHCKPIPQAAAGCDRRAHSSREHEPQER